MGQAEEKAKRKEARIGFDSLEELTAFFEKWMTGLSTLDSNQLQPKEIEP